MTATAAVPVVRLHAQAITAFDTVLRQVRPEHWHLPTPCASWDVQALVEHVIVEARWTPPLLGGLSADEVGTSLDGDLVQGDPPASWAQAQAAANRAAGGLAVAERTVHLSTGDTPAQEYLHQLTADYLIHSWDLAVALGVDDRLDAELVAAVGGWFLTRETAYRAAGAIGPPVTVEHDGHPQTRLLARFGREERSTAALAAVARFAAAFDHRDVDAVMAAMTVDCVFEATAPPDGIRHQGQRAVRAAWTEFFQASSDAVFETEEQFACGNRVVLRWRYTWAPGEGGHVRGVDIFRTRDGLVAEKLSYVKG